MVLYGHLLDLNQVILSVTDYNIQPRVAYKIYIFCRTLQLNTEEFQKNTEHSTKHHDEHVKVTNSTGAILFTVMVGVQP